jgi:ribonuclease J
MIGGSCVELRSDASRIILDLGIPLVKPDGTEFEIKEYAGLSGPELLAASVLPPVEGLYEWQEPSVAGVLISHSHQDHYGFLNHIHPDIPVYLGEGTRKLIEISAVFSPSKTILKRPVVFSWPGHFTVGDFRVVPHLVDHSAFGAFAFEIESAGKRIFYSGDFRDHGYLGKTLTIIRDKCAPDVDALLMEGTMFGREEGPVMTEQELADEAKVICRECPKSVLVYQSGQNVSRAVSFYKAARATGREFVLDFYSAHVLSELGKCTGGTSLPYPGNLPGIRVWYPNYLTNRLFNTNQGEIPIRYSTYKMTKEEMAEKLSNLVLYVRPGMDFDLKHIIGIEGSILLYSLWSGYHEKGSTKRFLDEVNALGITVQSLHTGGHASIGTLRALVETLHPKILLPIHTFYPDEYATTFGCIIGRITDGDEYIL